MDEYLAAVEQFEREIEINLFDLGAGVLLECFAAPLLIFSTAYVPLLRRQVVPPWEPEIARLNELSPDPDHPDTDGALERIGRSLDRRQRLLRRINRMTIAIRLGVVTVQMMILLSIMRGPNRPIVIGGWLLAMLIAMVVCLSDRHWRRRGGFRGSPG